MNLPLTSPDIVANPQLLRTRRFFITFSHLETPSPLGRSDISGDLTVFFSINGPLRAVEGTEERTESHVDLTRHCRKSAVAMRKDLHRVYLTWKHPRRSIEVTFQMTDIFLNKRALARVQRD
jgi:hypothetical protein